MKLVRYRLQKKWWHSTGKYIIKDATGKVVFNSKPIGVFKAGLELYNADKSERLMTISASSWTQTKFKLEIHDQIIADLRKKSVFSLAEFILADGNGEIDVKTKKWGKQTNFSRRNQDIAHASSSSILWNEVGVVVHEGVDARMIILVVILLAYNRARGAS